jgi:hypothetical protein
MVMNYVFGRYRSINLLLVFADLCITRFREKFYNNMIRSLVYKVALQREKYIVQYRSNNRKVNCSGI